MERFRTVKISDPRFEKEDLCYITLKTPNLKGRGNITVYVPPKVNRTDIPIVLLLHGVYGSANSWVRQAGAHLTAKLLINAGIIQPVILAMPSDGLWGDGSAYLPHNGYNFEKWIVEDVIDAVRLYIPAAQYSTKTCIAGLSMGGFGALRLGAKYGQKFKAISGISAITALEQMAIFVEEPISSYQQEDKTDESVLQTIKKYQSTLPPIRFDCGKDDILIEHNRELHQALNKENIPHIYKEFEGGHEWSYWEQHLDDTLQFFDQYL